MSDITPPDGRPLTEPERQSFQRLGLTPGHWAALAPTPLFYQRGVRVPNLRSAVEFGATDRLRRALRTLEGLSGEAAHFWDRLGEGTRSGEAKLATRLLAWHLATDIAFARRFDYFRMLGQTAEQFAQRGPHAPRPPDAVRNFRALVDSYLPYPEFVPHADPPHVAVPAPAAALEALAASVRTPAVHFWPPTNSAEVPRYLPTLLDLLGEPVREWWGLGDPARRAAERGLASRSFDDRQRVYASAFNEWHRALMSTDQWSNARELAQRFVNRMWEWADAVRSAAREPARAPPPPPVAEEVVPVAEVAPAPVPADSGRIPPALREVVLPPPAPKPPPKPVVERVTATVAEPFAMLTFEQALARARATTVADACKWADANPRLLFDDCRDDASRDVAVVKSGAAVPPALWVIGDVHADLLTLANAVAHAELLAAPNEPAHFLFLGDFVDRGIHDHETLLLLFGLLMAHPERVCVLPGNHDIDLLFDEKANRFRVTIDPAEYCEGLNAALARDAPDDRERVELARAFVRFCAGRPKAVFLPDGTLFAHGGFPHTDAQKDIAVLADLCRPRCRDDFLWGRIAESARVKRPNRGSRGHEFGWDTFAQFCTLAGERLDVPVRRLVRGHDHVPDRWQEYPEYADNFVPVLTLNAMGRALDGDSPRRDGRPHPLPALARYVPNHLPDVILLPLDPAEVDRAFLRAPAVATAAGDVP